MRSSLPRSSAVGLAPSRRLAASGTPSSGSSIGQLRRGASTAARVASSERTDQLVAPSGGALSGLAGPGPSSSIGSGSGWAGAAGAGAANSIVPAAGLPPVASSAAGAAAGPDAARAARVRARAAARRREQLAYQVSAIAATLGVGAIAAGATYYRFWLHMQDGAAFPWLDMGCTLALVLGGAVGMEMWARWAHKALWHDFAPGWALHKSHHEPRLGPFEANDVYAVANAVPAMGLCLYGFLTPGLAGSLCFGAGLGITVFGIAYMFIHDGLVHKRFPVGPIAELPAMKRIVVAHKLHHSEKYGGVPFGMFLGPQELEAIGAGPELDRLVADMEGGRR